MSRKHPRGPDSEVPEEKFQLSESKFATILEFRGQLYVNIRQYYKGDTGEMLPSRKGIMLRPEEWRKLMDRREYIEQWLEKFPTEEKLKNL